MSGCLWGIGGTEVGLKGFKRIGLCSNNLLLRMEGRKGIYIDDKTYN